MTPRPTAIRPRRPRWGVMRRRNRGDLRPELLALRVLRPVRERKVGSDGQKFGKSSPGGESTWQRGIAYSPRDWAVPAKPVLKAIRSSYRCTRSKPGTSAPGLSRGGEGSRTLSPPGGSVDDLVAKSLAQHLPRATGGRDANRAPPGVHRHSAGFKRWLCFPRVSTRRARSHGRVPSRTRT
jgi:hypothetical protein